MTKHDDHDHDRGLLTLEDGRTIIVTTERKPRMSWWRDLVLLLLIAAIMLLVLEGREDRQTIEQLRRAEAQAVMQRADVLTGLADLERQTADSQVAIATRDAEIRRLTDLLLTSGVDPGESLIDSNDDGDVDLGGSTQPTTQPAPQPRPTQQPTQQPSPPAPQPSPSPTPPAPSPSPTCNTSVLGVCILR